MRISAVVITRNEEHNIVNCLETLRWCDEIVVVDMESEDRTVELARQYTNRILSHPKVLAFDIAKKFAVEQASGDWILLLDADEMIQSSLAVTLRRRAEQEDADIVEIPFRHYIMGKCVEYSGWGYTPLPRFFRKGAVMFTGTIHDYMHCSDSARVVRLDSIQENCIIHFNYRNATHFVDKLNRYTSIEAMKLFDQGERFYYHKLILLTLREFYRRYISGQGYREGVRGFALALMMAFYRALTWIKVWELHTFKHDPVTDRYKRVRDEILKEWRK
jgi:glycosyltransferase involved in cell wall biosynthesis